MPFFSLGGVTVVGGAVLFGGSVVGTGETFGGAVIGTSIAGAGIGGAVVGGAVVTGGAVVRGGTVTTGASSSALIIERVNIFSKNFAISGTSTLSMRDIEPSAVEGTVMVSEAFFASLGLRMTRESPVKIQSDGKFGIEMENFCNLSPVFSKAIFIWAEPPAKTSEGRVKTGSNIERSTLRIKPVGADVPVCPPSIPPPPP